MRTPPNSLTVINNQREERPTPKWAFDHHRLDAYWVAKDALIRGMAIIEKLPRGFGVFKNQGRRALQGQFTQTTEAASRTGDDRKARFRSARAEAAEAAGILEALLDMRVVDEVETDAVIGLLWRLCAMLTGLFRPGR